MMMKAKYDVEGVITTQSKHGSSTKALLAVNGTVAKQLGIAKESGSLTPEDRARRILAAYDVEVLEVNSPENKLHPEGSEYRNAFFLETMVRSKLRPFKGDILTDLVAVEEECMLYMNFCLVHKMSPSLIGLCSWLGVTRRKVNELRTSDKPVGALLEKASDSIAHFRTEITDSGKLNPVWNMFVMGNDHNYTRSDNKNNFNIQINNQGYSNDEINNMLQEVDVFDDI